MKLRRLAVLLLFVAALMPATLRAHDYKCTECANGDCSRTNPKMTLVWTTHCIPYFINRRSNLLSGTERRTLIAQSFRTWSGMGNACTDLDFVDAGYTDDIEGFDPSKPSSQRNVVLAIEDQTQLNRLPGARLLAITLTSYSTETGELFDADILVNAVNFRFADVLDERACLSTPMPPFDLRNTLIHEAGHFIGFDHSLATDSTMFASAMACETSKRNPSPDDKLGLCTVYPSGQPSHTCVPPTRGYDAVSAGDPSKFRDQCARLNGGRGGCSCTMLASREQTARPWALMLLGLCGALARRRKLNGR